MLSFCPKKKSFAKIAKLNNGRHSHAACELDGKLYVFGGLAKLGKCVKSIERIDLFAQENKWTKFTPHLFTRYLGGKNYTIYLTASNLLACPVENGKILVLQNDQIDLRKRLADVY